MITFSKQIYFTIVMALTMASLSAELKVHSLFSNGAVLQRDISVPVWGWANLGQEVEVNFAGQSHKATADDNGKWILKLSAMKVSSEPKQMIIRSGSEELKINDLLIGDVWFCSGQSNMAMKVGACSKPGKDKKVAPVSSWILKEMEKASDPLLRAFNAQNEQKPSFDQTIEDFPGEWTKNDSHQTARLSAVAYFFAKELRTQTGVPIGLIIKAKSATKIEAWMTPESFKGDADMEAYFEKYRKQYEVDAAGFDQEKANKEYEAAMKKFNSLGGKKTKGNHRPKPPRHPRHSDQLPGSLFMGKVAPYQPFAIRGVIWYQGEKNGNHNTEKYGQNLEALINGWRESWGQGDFPFYFVQLANLGTENAPGKKGQVSGWVHVQDMQRRSLAIKNTGMAIANDLGQAKDIHPKNKVDVGKRLALWALKKDYGKDLKAWGGPLYKSHEVKDGKIQINFSHSGSGLMIARKHLLDPAKPVNEELGGFEIQGSDKKWMKAKARIVSENTVEVWSDQVKEPQQVRYAFVMNPASANLYNKEGLPASCFTTESIDKLKELSK